MVYKIRPRKGYPPETFRNYEILNGNHFIGWMLRAKYRIPIAFITAEHHKLDKAKLSVTLKAVDPDSEGIFLLITEYVNVLGDKNQK